MSAWVEMPNTLDGLIALWTVKELVADDRLRALIHLAKDLERAVPQTAAPPLPSVSRGKLQDALHAQQKVQEFYSLREVSNALRALGINVEDGK